MANPSSSNKDVYFVTQQPKNKNVQEKMEKQDIVEQQYQQYQENYDWDDVVEETYDLGEFNEMIDEQVGWYHKAKKFVDKTRCN